MKETLVRNIVIILAAFLVIGLSGYLVLTCAPFSGKNPAPDRGPDPMYQALAYAENGTTRDLEQLDRVVSRGASRMGVAGVEGVDTHAILAEMGQSPYVVDVITINTNGTILAVEPDTLSAIVGTNIGNQPHIAALITHNTPVMGNVFMSVEGVEAADIASPVFSPDGRVTGATSLLFRPADIIRAHVPLKTDGTPWHIWVMQTDGLVIYDPDPGEAGKNIFSDPSFQPYPELIRLARVISDKTTGSGSYSYHDSNGTDVVKEVCWTTTGLHGTEWRIVITRIPGRDDG